MCEQTTTRVVKVLSSTSQWSLTLNTNGNPDFAEFYWLIRHAVMWCAVRNIRDTTIQDD